MTQMDLSGWFATPAADPKPAKVPRPSIEERFATFHAANPHVFDRLVRLACDRLARGDARIGVKALIEELRCYLATTGSEAGGERYRLDNSLVSRYADLLAETDPRIAAAIERRKRRA